MVKIDSKLSTKKETASKNRFSHERMARNNSWWAPRINIRVYFVHHFHKSLLFINEADDFNFVGGTTLSKCGRDLELVSIKLEIYANIAIQ